MEHLLLSNPNHVDKTARITPLDLQILNTEHPKGVFIASLIEIHVV